MEQGTNAAGRRVKLLTTIVNRGRGVKVIELCQKEWVIHHLSMMGIGTAKSELLDYLGLGETEKDVILSVVPEGRLPAVWDTLREQLKIELPGGGIAFTVPISSVGGPVTLQFLSGNFGGNAARAAGEESKMESEKAFELIITMVNRGFADDAMDAAKEAGAQGGTVLYARGTGIHEAQKFFGITIEPEKEVVLILVERAKKNDILKAICAGAGLTTPGRGMSFTLPVDDVMGIVHLDQGQAAGNQEH